VIAQKKRLPVKATQKSKMNEQGIYTAESLDFSFVKYTVFYVSN